MFITAPILCIGAEHRGVPLGAPWCSVPMHNIEAIISFFNGILYYFLYLAIV